MRRSQRIPLFLFGLFLVAIWMLSSQELPREPEESQDDHVISPTEIASSSDEVIRSAVVSKPSSEVQVIEPAVVPVEQERRFGALSGYVAPGWVGGSGMDVKIRIFRVPGEEDGPRPTLVTSKETRQDSIYQMSAPEGEYIPGIQVGGTTFFGEAVRLSAEQTTVCDFYPGEGNRVFGAFQYELQPELSTFTLEVIRESDMKVICNLQLSPNASLAKSAGAAEDQDKNNIDRRRPHGYFSVDELPPDTYILRFSAESIGPDGGPFWFVWDHSVDLLFGDFNFDTQYADFSRYKEHFITELPE